MKPLLPAKLLESVAGVHSRVHARDNCFGCENALSALSSRHVPYLIYSAY